MVDPEGNEVEQPDAIELGVSIVRRTIGYGIKMATWFSLIATVVIIGVMIYYV
jgi:hypothetical protein